MSVKSTLSRSTSFLAAILFLQLAMLVTVLLDITVARQIVAFVYLTFLPGFLIVKLLKIGESSLLEVFVFSVGLSVAFLMLTGLLFNVFFTLSGLSQPLSLIPLLVFFSIIISILGIWAYLRNSHIGAFEIDELSLYQKLYLLLILVLPISSVVGAMWVNVYENNLILLLMLLGIVILFVAGVLSKRLLPPSLYPLVVFAFALSLVLHAALISNYIYCGDIHLEYFVFQNTESSLQWNSVWMYPSDEIYGRLYAMLSVTILPTIYSVILNLNADWVLKVLYPIIFSVVPIVLYRLWHKAIGAKRAFLASFLFMSMSMFFAEMLGLARQMIAEFFLVLLLLVILSKEIKPLNKIMLFTIFSMALIVSHYAIAEIFLVFLCLCSVLLIVWKRPSRRITLSMIVLFFSLMFGWYIFTTNSSVFNSFQTFGQSVVSQLGNFFDPASRGGSVLRGLGLEAPPSIWNSISRIFAYLTQGLIVIGFLGTCTKRAKVYFERDYFVFGFVALGILVSLIVVPGLANTLNMNRFYHILLIFLAPFFVIGGEVIGSFISKRKTGLVVSILLLIVVVPYFLFQTNFVYEVAGVESWSVPLSKYRIEESVLSRTFGLLNTWKISGASWLKEYTNARDWYIHADFTAAELVRTGLRFWNPLYNTTIMPNYGLVYITYANSVNGLVISENSVFNLTELTYIHDMDKLYDNGGIQVYKPPPV